MILKSEPDKIYGLDTYEFTREYKSGVFKKAEENGLKIINITEVIGEKSETLWIKNYKNIYMIISIILII